LLVQALGDEPQLTVNFARRGSHNQTAQGISSTSDVIVAPHQMNLSVGYDDSRLCCVLNRVLGLALLPGETSDASGHVISVQRLHVLYEKALDEEVI